MADRTLSHRLKDLARAMIKQAKLLRDQGLAEDARALARRAVALDQLGWSYARPIPIRTRGRRRL